MKGRTEREKLGLYINSLKKRKKKEERIYREIKGKSAKKKVIRSGLIYIL